MNKNNTIHWTSRVLISFCWWIWTKMSTPLQRGYRRGAGSFQKEGGEFLGWFTRVSSRLQVDKSRSASRRNPGCPEDCQYHYPTVKGSVNACLCVSCRKSNLQPPSFLVQDTGLPMKRPPLFLFPPTFEEEGGDSLVAVVRNRALEISFPFVPRSVGSCSFYSLAFSDRIFVYFKGIVSSCIL